ncbi:MAG TPA: hypothetical protein VNO30_38930 [Kofleriaceae bacterium]|nr:hypothetical protein [Kofleriaceae bacterium]
MKQLIWIAAAAGLTLGALAGCSKKSDNAAKGGESSACATAAAKAVASLPGAGATGVKDKLQSIYATRCAEDKWAPEVIQCYESASGMQGLTACRAKLPPELGQKLRGEIMAAMAGGAGGMSAPPGHGGGAMAPGGDPPAPGGTAPAPAPSGDPPAAGGPPPGGAAPAPTK